MSAAHTPGPLAQSHRKGADGMHRTEIFSEEYGGVATCEWTPKNLGNGVTGTYREANARRLVACWNACDGISTDVLEKGRVSPDAFQIEESRADKAELKCDELLAALTRILALPVHKDAIRMAHHHADAAITKAAT